MGTKILIIGAVALGPKVACRMRRLDPEADITLIDRDNIISYGGCGIPYYVGGDVSDIEDLCKTSSHVLRDERFFAECKDVRVLTGVEALGIDRREKRVRVRCLDDCSEEFLEYDKLVIATGGEALRPSFPGADLPGIFIVSNLRDAKAVKELIASGKVETAAVIGAGAVGLEIAEALSDLWGITTTLIEREDQVLPTILGTCTARMAARELERHGVELLLDDTVQEISAGADNGPMQVRTSRATIAADLVVLAAGTRPNTNLAREAGLSLGMSGGILVDQRMRTSDPHIYAGGDCIELRNLVSGENMPMPLGSLANRQGRIIATNLSGGQGHFPGTVGAFCLKVFDLTISKAGLTLHQARLSGFNPVCAMVSQVDHAHFYPDASMMYISLIADRSSRKILGIEMAGSNGDAVKGRVDTVAVLLRHGVDVDEICTLETGYAPPYSSAMDIINNAGNALDNILAGKNRPIDAADFLQEFGQGIIRVLDIRGEKEAAPFIARYGALWHNIPQDQLRRRAGELSVDEPFFLLCDTGSRSYEAQVFLDSRGITATRHIQGGFAVLREIDPAWGQM